MTTTAHALPLIPVVSLNAPVLVTAGRWAGRTGTLRGYHVSAAGIMPIVRMNGDLTVRVAAAEPAAS